MTTHTTRLDLIREAIGDRRPTEPISWVHDLAHAIDAALPPDPHPLPVVLPEVSDEDVAAACTTYITPDGIANYERVRRALTAYHARLQASLPIWDPIEPGDIKPGMRVRFVDETAGYEVIIPRVDHLERSRGLIRCGRTQSGRGRAPTYWATLGRSWSVDPRTIPVSLASILGEYEIPSDAEDRIRAAVLAEDAKQREGVGR